MSGLCQHLSLIGYRASGKTSIGMRLAEHFHCPWVDLDAYIEESCNRSIPDIFEQNGEAYFRDLESDCLVELCRHEQAQILSTGGGVVLREQNCRILAEHCQHVIYLKADAAVLSERLRENGGDRPSLTGGAIADEVAAVLAQRASHYEHAATDIVDANKGFDEIVQQIVNIVEN